MHLKTELRLFVLTWIVLVDSNTACAATDWGPKEQAYYQQLDEMKERTVERLFLGLHGELFLCSGLMNSRFAGSMVYAVREKKGREMELVVDRDRELISYARVSSEGRVSYEQTPEALELTGEGFCGIRKWPQADALEPTRDGEVRVIADMEGCSLPEKPGDCEAVAYALSNGGFLFCQPNGVFSPYPLWLVRVNKNQMRLVPTDRTGKLYLDIIVLEGIGYVTMWRDARMKLLSPPARGLYCLDEPGLGVLAPKALLCLTPKEPDSCRPPGSDTGPSFSE